MCRSSVVLHATGMNRRLETLVLGYTAAREPGGD